MDGVLVCLFDLPLPSPNNSTGPLEQLLSIYTASTNQADKFRVYSYKRAINVLKTYGKNIRTNADVDLLRKDCTVCIFCFVHFF